YAHHRQLHSFPTRRSSDLKKFPDEPDETFRSASGWPLANSLFNSSRQKARSEAAAMENCSAARAAGLKEACARQTMRGRIGKRRSEEHTSELQSRFDLVCR